MILWEPVIFSEPVNCSFTIECLVLQFVVLNYTARTSEITRILTYMSMISYFNYISSHGRDWKDCVIHVLLILTTLPN